jgi:NAD(P)-dependent dehydrogenase (short-subunit alcohol dehydrogenase family)
MTSYAEVHANTKGTGDARPTASQIISDNDMEGKLDDKVIVLTGASSGIGIDTARALSLTGATLILPVRDTKKAQAALKDILEPGRVSLIQMDSASFASVRKAAATILEQCNNKVNILVGNAGAMGMPTRTLTGDGHEMQFQTNHLSHFLLFELLKPALLASSTPSFHSRVVLLTSSAHRTTTLRASDDFSFEKGTYDAGVAYAQSKLANIYTANEIERRYGAKGLHGLSVQPGAIDTPISREFPADLVAQILASPGVAKIQKSPEQGAATTVLAAIGKEWEGRGGKYLEDCGEAGRGEDDGNIMSLGWVKQTYDEAEEARLWRESCKIVGVSAEE